MAMSLTPAETGWGSETPALSPVLRLGLAYSARVASYATGELGTVEIESHWTAARRGHQLPEMLPYRLRKGWAPWSSGSSATADGSPPHGRGPVPPPQEARTASWGPRLRGDPGPGAPIFVVGLHPRTRAARHANHPGKTDASYKPLEEVAGDGAQFFRAIAQVGQKLSSLFSSARRPFNIRLQCVAHQLRQVIGNAAIDRNPGLLDRRD